VEQTSLRKTSVIPAQAGIQVPGASPSRCLVAVMDPRLRGDDGRFEISA